MNTRLILSLLIMVSSFGSCTDYDKQVVDHDAANFVTLAETYVSNEHKTGLMDSILHSKAFENLTLNKHQYLIYIYKIKYPDTPNTENVFTQKNLPEGLKDKDEYLKKGESAIVFGTGLELDRQFQVRYRLYRLTESDSKRHRYCLEAELLSLRLVTQEPIEGYQGEDVMSYIKYY